MIERKSDKTFGNAGKTHLHTEKTEIEKNAINEMHRVDANTENAHKFDSISESKRTANEKIEVVKTDAEMHAEEERDRLRIHELQAIAVGKTGIEVRQHEYVKHRPETEKQRILREAGGLPSNVGINSPYWHLPD